MRWRAFSAFIVGVGSFVAARFAEPHEVTLVFSGDFRGYLTPCGCSTPQIGGIRRQATIVRRLQADGDVAVLFNSGSVSGTDTQSQYKAEALAQLVGLYPDGAMNLGLAEASLPGLAATLYSLSRGRLVSAMAQEGQTAPSRVIGPFLVTGIDVDPPHMSAAIGASAPDVDAAVTQFIDQAKASGLGPILMLRGGESAARSIAMRHPELLAIEYQSANPPSDRPLMQGTTLLISPGDRGRYLVVMRSGGKALHAYDVIPLGPNVPDDSLGRRVDAEYVARVERAGLLDLLPRKSRARYVGSPACAKCHKQEYAVWKVSDHAKTFATLRAVGRGHDPDCVGCHVTGLDSTNGFRSAMTTPKLARVTCESCHGAGEQHARTPRRFRLKPRYHVCATCHTADNSPQFEFRRYWAKIAHGKPLKLPKSPSHGGKRVD